MPHNLFSEIDETMMRRCFELACRGHGKVAPNPLVGAVITRNNRIIGEGYHEKFGAPHAEPNAIASLQEPPKGATLYVNLEPCCHHGKTPPCTDAIIKNEFSRVVVGTKDPFSLVSGKGISTLMAAGVETDVGCLENEARYLNRRFFIRHKFDRPYIILKWAETADGFLARSDYSSRWISCEESRARVHKWRSEESSILVGTNTALYDDPLLTARVGDAQNVCQPQRLVLDRFGRLPKTLRLFQGEPKTLVLGNEWKNLLMTEIPLRICNYLITLNLISVIIEGGAHLLQSFLDSDLWDEARVFRCPVKFGTGIAAPNLARNSSNKVIAEESVGKDLLVTYSNHWVREAIAQCRVSHI